MAGASHHVRIDRGKTLAEEPATGHNRWHEAIPPILRVVPGDRVVLETRDALDGQFTPASTTEDVARADLLPVHPLTGPVAVEGADVGDLLEVRIEEIRPEPFGFTAQVPGFGFLRDVFTEPHLVRWQIADGWATSEDLPGVRVPGAPFMGVIGVAPSAELREMLRAREADAASRGGVALPPDPAGAVPGNPEIARTALRTIPPREIGGNLDVKQLTAGTTLLIPVYAPGALFSVGDAHFAQGDGEACGTAIEMGATFVGELHLRKGEAARRNIRSVQFSREEYVLDPRFQAPRRFYATTGLSVRADGRQESEDATLAARNALLAMIDYLVDERKYTAQQAYAICSVAVDLKFSELVDVPNVVVTAVLPLDIFV
ncbi:MAG: acetamidase/formamidase family protein [Chloroflexota bacterium]|nr:acetamidase/formamidase family protein [Chloroflexota bacterium]